MERVSQPLQRRAHKELLGDPRTVVVAGLRRDRRRQIAEIRAQSRCTRWAAGTGCRPDMTRSLIQDPAVTKVVAGSAPALRERRTGRHDHRERCARRSCSVASARPLRRSACPAPRAGCCRRREADVGAGYPPPGVLVNLTRRSQHLEWKVRLPSMRERGEDGVVGEREQRGFELRSSLRRPSS